MDPSLAAAFQCVLAGSGFNLASLDSVERRFCWNFISLVVRCILLGVLKVVLYCRFK